MPEWITGSRKTLIKKVTKKKQKKKKKETNYRPITRLLLMFKIFTRQRTQKINEYMESKKGAGKGRKTQTI